MDRWEGRVALVTGASQGIGAAICRELVKHGMTVLGCGNEHFDKIEKMAKELEGPGRLVAFKCDMRKETEIRAMYEEIRQKKITEIHVCINNAVSLCNKPLVGGGDDSKGWTEDWMKMMEVNVLGVCINTREVLQMMKKGGQIIQMGGITGHKIPNIEGKPDTPTTGFNFYHGTKFMIRALTEGLRQEVKNKKIRVSTISPGSVTTQLLEKATTPKEAAAYFNTYRCLSPEDVVSAVIFILSARDHVNIHDIIMEPIDIMV